MSELDDDLDPAQARQRGDTVLLADASPDGEVIAATLRARGFDVVPVPLLGLEARLAGDAPRVVLVDIDAPGAVEAVERLHRLPEGAAVTVLLIGDPVRSAELEPHMFGQVFERPVDLAELAAHVGSVVAPVRSRARGTTPPPSYALRPPSRRSETMESDAPSHPDFTGDIDPIDVGSMLPAMGMDEGEGDGMPPKMFPARLSPELEHLLAAAEQRITAKAHPSSVPSVDDEVDLILSPELLSALDEPLDSDAEGPNTGAGGTPMHGATGQRGTPPTGTQGLAAGVQSLGERSLRAADLPPPGEPPSWIGAPRHAAAEAPREPSRAEPSRAEQARAEQAGPAQERPTTKRAGSDHPQYQHVAAPQEPDERWVTITRNEERRRPEPDERPVGFVGELGFGAEGAVRRPEAPNVELELDRVAPPRLDVESDRERIPTQREAGRDRSGAGRKDADRPPAASLEAHLVNPPREVQLRSLPDDDPASRDRGTPSERRAPSARAHMPTPASGAFTAPAAPTQPASISGAGLLSRAGPPTAPGPPPTAAPAPPGAAASPAAGAAASARHASPFYVPGEEPPPSSAAPVATVLGPGDAPRALARAIGSRASGALAVTTEAGWRRVVLHDGDLVTAGSGVPEETLLSFLVARGDIERDVAVRLAGRLPPSGRLAGAALIAHGYLGQDDLWPVLRGHAEWLIGQVILIEAGACELEEEPPGRLKAEPNVFGGATGAEVFMETVRRVIAPDVALRRIGGPTARIDEGARRSLLGECALRPQEEELVRSARGRAVSELLGAEPELASALYALVCLEVLDVLLPPAVTDTPPAPIEDPLDDEAIRQRVRARLSLVEDGDYFAILGVPREATSYEIRRAYLALRRAFEPSTLLTASTVDLLDDVRLVIEVLDEAYDILRETHRRERYRRALEAGPP